MPDEHDVQSSHQRVVILMCDGLGADYYAAAPMPTVKAWAQGGVFAEVKAVAPTVTNANNVSICCGSWPETHGTIGNSWFDATTGAEEYMESADLVLAPTIFERAARHGVRSALLTSKKKTVSLMGRGAELTLAAEEPAPDWVGRLGPAPDIYSREINYWLLESTIETLELSPHFGLLYVHTTDYPMHMWPPEAPETQEHLACLDQLLARAATAAPDAAFLITADHGMNAKTRCWDLDRALAARSAPIRLSISAERDKYLQHHRGFGGMAWIHLNNAEDGGKVADALRSIPGVERVLTRGEAAQEFHLLESRIGDLVALGDRETVFGRLDTESETLAPGYRNHGSLHEQDVPLVIYNAEAAPDSSYFKNNFDLARWLYR
jgi:phosphonoacetate hydrolase